MTTPKRHERVYELFVNARKLDDTARAAYLAKACADDPSLREEVEAILAQHDEQPSFLSNFRPPSLTLNETAAASLRSRGFTPPARVGSYRIERHIGSGAMGHVYKGWDESLNRPVAIKFLPGGTTTECPASALSEGAAVASVRHANIVTVHASGHIGEHAYLVMEYVDGVTLRQILSFSGALPLNAALEVMRQTAKAVAALHQHGIIHRDLKPANVLVDEEGHVRVTDFGLSLPDVSGWKEAPQAGTPHYMSSEMFEGRVSPRSDVYALGIIFFELLAGVVPFKTDPQESWESRVKALAELHANKALPESLLPNDLPDAILDVIQRATHKNDIFRHKTAQHFFSTLPVAEGIRDDTGRVVLARLASAARSPTVLRKAQDSEPSPHKTIWDLVKTRILDTRRRLQRPFVEKKALDAGAILTPDAIKADVPCRNCRYNLRFVSASKVCPECNTPARDSLDPSLLIFADPAWLRIIRCGILLYVFAIILYIVGFSIDRNVLPLSASTLLSRFVSLAGVLLCTVRAARSPHSSLLGVTAFVARLAALADVIVLAWASVSPSLAVRAVSETFFGAYAVIAFYLSLLAARVPSSALCASLRISAVSLLMISLAGPWSNTYLYGIASEIVFVPWAAFIVWFYWVLRTVARHAVPAEQLANTGMPQPRPALSSGGRVDLRPTLAYMFGAIAVFALTSFRMPEIWHATYLYSQGRTAMEDEDLDTAEKMLSQSRELRLRLRGESHPETLYASSRLAEVLRRKGEHQQALQLARSATQGLRQHGLLRFDANDGLAAISTLCDIYFQEERWQEARRCLAEEVDLRTSENGRKHPWTMQARMQLALTLLHLEHYEEVEPLLLEAYERILPPPSSLNLKQEAVERVVKLYNAHRQKAVERIVKLYDAWDAAEPGKGHDAKAADWRAKLPDTDPDAPSP